MQVLDSRGFDNSYWSLWHHRKLGKQLCTQVYAEIKTCPWFINTVHHSGFELWFREREKYMAYA